MEIVAALWDAVKLVTIIKALYEGFSARVIHNGQKTELLNMVSDKATDEDSL